MLEGFEFCHHFHTVYVIDLIQILQKKKTVPESLFQSSSVFRVYHATITSFIMCQMPYTQFHLYELILSRIEWVFKNPPDVLISYSVQLE